MKPITTLLSGLSLIAIGIVLSAFPVWYEHGIDAWRSVYSSPNIRTADEIASSLELYNNDSIVFIGIIIAAVGFLYTLVIYPIFAFAPFSVRFLLFSLTFLFFTVFPGIIAPDWFIKPITFVVMMALSIIFIAASPFSEQIFQYLTGRRNPLKKMEDANKHINSAFSIMMKHKNYIRKSEKIISKIEKQTKEDYSDPQKIREIYREIAKDNRISVIQGVLIGILSTISVTIMFNIDRAIEYANKLVFH